MKKTHQIIIADKNLITTDYQKLIGLKAYKIDPKTLSTFDQQRRGLNNIILII